MRALLNPPRFPSARARHNFPPRLPLRGNFESFPNFSTDPLPANVHMAVPSLDFVFFSMTLKSLYPRPSDRLSIVRFIDCSLSTSLSSLYIRSSIHNIEFRQIGLRKSSEKPSRFLIRADRMHDIDGELETKILPCRRRVPIRGLGPSLWGVSLAPLEIDNVERQTRRLDQHN